MNFSRDLSAHKKPSKWALPNKGVHARAARDLEQEVLDRRTVESTRAALERKAKIYEKLKKGQSGGLNEAQFDALLVDVRFVPNPLLWRTMGPTVAVAVRLETGRSLRVRQRRCRRVIDSARPWRGCACFHLL